MTLIRYTSTQAQEGGRRVVLRRRIHNIDTELRLRLELLPKHIIDLNVREFLFAYFFIASQVRILWRLAERLLLLLMHHELQLRLLFHTFGFGAVV